MKKISQKGSSTLEILIAFAILILSITTVIIVLFGDQSVSVDTQTNNEALYRAQTMLETARAASRGDFYSVISQGAVIEQSGSITYTKNLDVADIDAFTKQATSTVTWHIGPRAFRISLSTILTNISGALSGETCSLTLTGDWAHPQLLGSADTGQGNNGTDVDVLNKKAYITTDASVASKDDLSIVDVSDPTKANLPIVGSVNTGPGLAGVRVAGKYAYVANISTVSQLQVIDISNPSVPTVVTNVKVIPAGDTAVGNSIYYANKKIYLGLTKSIGPEFIVIDVSDPLHPIKKASYETNTQINAITVSNGIAYVAVPDDPSSATPEQLRLLDVSHADSGSIAPINTFSYPNASTMSGESVYLSKDGTFLYFGRGGANSAKNPEFFVLNVSDPNSIAQMSGKYIKSSVNAIVVRSNLAFLWTTDTNHNFQIWNLNDMSSLNPYGSLNTQQIAAGGFDCEGNFIYVAHHSNKALQIIGPGN